MVVSVLKLLQMQLTARTVPCIPNQLHVSQITAIKLGLNGALPKITTGKKITVWIASRKIYSCHAWKDNRPSFDCLFSRTCQFLCSGNNLSVTTIICMWTHCVFFFHVSVEINSQKIWIVIIKLNYTIRIFFLKELAAATILSGFWRHLLKLHSLYC